MGKIEVEKGDFKNKVIQPYKLAAMMKVSAQITDKLCNIPQFIADYDDIEFILETVMAAVKRARKKDENGI